MAKFSVFEASCELGVENGSRVYVETIKILDTNALKGLSLLWHQHRILVAFINAGGQSRRGEIRPTHDRD